MAEERLTDDPFKRKLEGEEELPEFELDEGAEEYDEDLVGLTPSMLQKRLEERRQAEERANAEYKKLRRTAAEKREAGDFAGAAAFYAQAAVYGKEDDSDILLWACRTEEYTSTACFYDREIAEEFGYAQEDVRKKTLKNIGEKLRTELAEYEAEATPLRKKVEAGMSSRRGAFRDNRNYWLVRFMVSLGLVIAFAIACAVTGNYIVRRTGTEGIVVGVLTGVFGLLALCALVVMFLFSRKLFLAQRLVSDNEKLSSTEDGMRLKELEQNISYLRFALDGAPMSEEEASEDEEVESTEFEEE